MPQHARRIGVLLAALVVAATAALAAVAAPARHAGGTLSFCSDITYPPEEFYVGSKPAGSDIDIGTAVAKQLGMKASFTNTGFDGIIAALLAKKCDAIISGMNDTPARAKQVAFVDYLSVGQSLMVKSGNPDHVTNLASLAGKTVSVEVGTTNKDFLDAESKKLQKQGKSAIKVQAFPQDTAAAAALKAGRVDAYFGDSPVVAYYIQKDKSFAFAGAPINPIPVGIALRHGDPNQAKIAKAVKTLYANGTMKRILAKWHMSAFALKKQ
jgi:polar amino acid transport system substrate-binding protein